MSLVVFLIPLIFFLVYTVLAADSFFTSIFSLFMSLLFLSGYLFSINSVLSLLLLLVYLGSLIILFAYIWMLVSSSSPVPSSWFFAFFLLLFSYPLPFFASSPLGPLALPSALLLLLSLFLLLGIVIVVALVDFVYYSKPIS